MSKIFNRKILIVFGFGLLLLVFFKSCVIANVSPEDSTVITTKITALREGPSYDIQFKAIDGSTFYINRGLEAGLILDSLTSKVLNKTVTLHLANLAFGPTKHISQLAVDDQILYSEFKN